MLQFKKNFLFLLLICLISLLFLNSVNATATYLTENQTWYQNLTKASQGSVVFGDIDNDGDLDLALTGQATSGTINKIYENNGTSFRENNTWSQNLTGVDYSSHMFGDIDNDGDLDLALTGCNIGAGAVSACNNGKDLTKIYENNGTSFVENTTWSQNLTAVYRSSLMFGDIDNDGDLDLALTGTSTSVGRIVKIYLNNGTSFIESEQWYENLTGVTDSFLVLGYINNDEKLDLIISGKDSSHNKFTKVYLNNGTSLVESLQWYQNLHAVNEGSLVLGDFDNDSDLDLSLTGCCDHHRIYENNGTSFVEIQKESGPITGGNLKGILESSQALGDYDNDGDLDLITTGREGFTTLYLYNSSALNFTSALQDPESHIINLEWSSVAWGDFDNNSALDLIEVGKHAILPSRHALIYSNNISTSNTQPYHPLHKHFTNYTTSSGDIHLGWGNGSDSETPAKGLYYNLRVGSTSGGNQIISGKYGGGEDNGYFGNMQQRKNFTLKTSRLSTNSKYFWSVQTIDTALKASNWSKEQTFNTSGDLTVPNITLNAPVNYFNTSTPQLNITFNATVFDNINVTNVTLWGNWTGSWHLNRTNSTGINTSMDYIFSVNLSSSSDGYYIWAIKSCDNSSICATTGNRTFLIDTTKPYVNLITPANNSNLNYNNIEFNYNVSDVSISNCSLIIDSSREQTDYSIELATQLTFTTTLANGMYNWNINCTDQVNQQNTTKINKLTVNYQPSTGGPSSRAGKRAQITPKKEIKEPEKKIEKPTKKITIKDEHLKEIPKEPTIKKKITTFFETIYAFIISLFIILSYTWIIKGDFKKLK